MLRNVVLGFGALSLIGMALPGIAGNTAPAIMLGVWGVILIAGTIFERVRYKPVLPKQPRGAVRTQERFFDETTQKPVTVYVDPATGERSYVED